ncbi:DUF7344 domain-containing protein [Halopiger xanaduensis]|uniref:DUF7344 domain-containing protein n=1 Tax=Halopiger xanaduensis (strain DSM 18323 / JCM 14033 / SH-6) TaxID=797210 RepID=F8DB15_HALXS|nr:hypothetical protein [Halopiger xanaduensis]AEH38265.1 hypothetical protein Halxa_3657 [Halopiger xanaduensis SH-6]
MGERIRRGSNESTPDRPSPTESAVTDPATTNRLDELFSLLSNSRRRWLLYALATADGAVVERSQLVSWLADVEASGAAESNDALEGRIAHDLHHNQLPRLEAAGIVDYDPRQGTVRYDGLPFRTEWLEHAHYKETGELLSEAETRR